MFAFVRLPLPLLFMVLISCLPAHAGEDWLPINPEELKMTSEPKAPGAMAIYLYRQVDRDDVESTEFIYVRTKIFTEQGRKYADIEIPFFKGFGEIKKIQARTIHPDGRIIDFDGKVYEKTVVKAKGFKFLAKTFTMPDVQPGSIIEYRYSRRNPEWSFYGSRWILSEELFTRHAKFSLRQGRFFGLRWDWPRGLPPGTNPPVEDRGIIRLETYDVPAFQIEDYMPPQEEMKYRVDFTYTNDLEKDPEKFWQVQSKRYYHAIEPYFEKHKAMERALSEIVAPSDTAEQKLRKIYARSQKIRNISYEREKTKQETERERLRNTKSVEDVWKLGYGDSWSITWLFMALARAAGFEATPVIVASRDRIFFDPKLMDPNGLSAAVVAVKVDGKEMYFNPGIECAPFGILPWSQTGSPGLRLTKDGGSWITTPETESSVSGINRQGTFQLDDSGNLEGDVTVTYKGLSALWRRNEEDDADDPARKKFLEDELKSFVPVSMEAELTSTPNWNASDTTLIAQFHVKIPGWASNAGHRTLVPAEIFGAGEKHVFESTIRVHPIYFSYAYVDSDDIIVKLPPGWQISNLPRPQGNNLKALEYSIDAEKKESALHVSRKLAVNAEMVDVKYYSAVRKFFDDVRTGDDQQVVLSASSSTN